MELCVIGLWVGTQHSRVIIKALLHTTAVCLCHCCLLWTKPTIVSYTSCAAHSWSFHSWLQTQTQEAAMMSSKGDRADVRLHCTNRAGSHRGGQVQGRERRGGKRDTSGRQARCQHAGLRWKTTTAAGSPQWRRHNWFCHRSMNVLRFLLSYMLSAGLLEVFSNSRSIEVASI